MKWLFSVSYYTPYISGLTIYVKRLAEELAKANNDISVISMRYDPKLEYKEMINGVKVVRSRVVAKINKGCVSINWIWDAWKEIKGAGVVVVNLPQAEGLIPAIWAKLLHKKLIAIYHCEIEMPNKLIQWVLEQTNWVTLDLADKIVSYTQDYADHSRWLKMYSDKLEIVYPPIPHLDHDKKLELEIKNKIGRGIVVGVAARLAQEKGIEYLIEALPLVKQKIKIVIAGPMDPVGEKKYKDKILKLVEKYKEQIIFLGEINPEKMGAFYKTIDMLVLPSVNSTEAFGMVQVEAMMVGVPVIASDLPGVRVPISVTGMGKVVPIKNPRALAEAIEEVLKNKTRLTKDYEEVDQIFKMEETIKFYERLAE